MRGVLFAGMAFSAIRSRFCSAGNDAICGEIFL